MKRNSLTDVILPVSASETGPDRPAEIRKTGGARRGHGGGLLLLFAQSCWPLISRADSSARRAAVHDEADVLPGRHVFPNLLEGRQGHWENFAAELVVVALLQRLHKVLESLSEVRRCLVPLQPGRGPVFRIVLGDLARSDRWRTGPASCRPVRPLLPPGSVPVLCCPAQSTAADGVGLAGLAGKTVHPTPDEVRRSFLDRGVSESVVNDALPMMAKEGP